MQLIGTNLNVFSDVQCSDTNLMQYIISEHELKPSEVHIARSRFLSALKVQL